MRHGFADTRYGQVHYVEQGSGHPVVLLHQTPRSSDEYRDVLPLLGRDFRAIAMDTVGFGLSARPDEPWSIELFADAVLDLCHDLGLGRFSLAGHHTGGVIAVEVAARAGERLAGLVLSGTPYVDAERRRTVERRPPIDHVDVKADGTHLLEHWRKRLPHYPADRPDLMNRLVRDALGVIDRVEEGHLAVNRYRMEDRIPLVRTPTLAICGELDGYSLPDLPRIAAAIPGARAAALPGAGVVLVDHRPDLFSEVVGEFLTECLSPGGQPTRLP